MAGWIGQNPQRDVRRRDRSRARGVTLIEVMLAASILVLMVLSIFEGIAVSARIARENAEYLQADAYAFDLVWKRYNESYEALRGFIPASSTTRTFEAETITEEAAPMLFHAGSPARSTTTFRRVVNPSDSTEELGILISVDVEWGPADKRRRLSSTHRAQVFKAALGEG
jgi:hypothetical protein